MRFREAFFGIYLALEVRCGWKKGLDLFLCVGFKFFDLLSVLDVSLSLFSKLLRFLVFNLYEK